MRTYIQALTLPRFVLLMIRALNLHRAILNDVAHPAMFRLPLLAVYFAAALFHFRPGPVAVARDDVVFQRLVFLVLEA